MVWNIPKLSKSMMHNLEYVYEYICVLKIIHHSQAHILSIYQANILSTNKEQYLCCDGDRLHPVFILTKMSHFDRTVLEVAFFLLGNLLNFWYNFSTFFVYTFFSKIYSFELSLLNQLYII